MSCAHHANSAACFRMLLTPIDTLKTTLQAQGARGTALLGRRIKTYGIGSLWWGALATAAATFVGHYPWFATVGSASELKRRMRDADFLIVQLPIGCTDRASETPSFLVAFASSIHWLLRLDRLGYHLQLTTSCQDLSPGQ